MTRTQKKAGRKPKPKEMKRSIRKELCFTIREWDLVVQAATAAGVEPGVYGREAVMDKAVRQA